MSAMARERDTLRCQQIEQRLLQRHGLALPAGLRPDEGAPVCSGVLAAGGSSWMDWNVTVALHMGLADGGRSPAAPQCASPPPSQQQQQEEDRAAGTTAPEQPPPAGATQQQQQQQQQPPRRRPTIMTLVAEHPSAGGIYLSNLLCMPRLTLMWHWLTGEWRSALAAVGSGRGSSSSASSSSGSDDEGPEAAGEEAAAAPAAAGEEGWDAVRDELSMLQVRGARMGTAADCHCTWWWWRVSC
jgi:hypothetical protein